MDMEYWEIGAMANVYLVGLYIHLPLLQMICTRPGIAPATGGVIQSLDSTLKDPTLAVHFWISFPNCQEQPVAHVS